MHECLSYKFYFKNKTKCNYQISFKISQKTQTNNTFNNLKLNNFCFQRINMVLNGYRTCVERTFCINLCVILVYVSFTFTRN